MNIQASSVSRLLRCIAIALVLAPASLAAQDTITVDAAVVIADVSRKPIGVNVNFLLDDDEHRPKALTNLAEALKDAGVKYLRYPGGEKSDAYLWSVPPYTQSVPTLARWATGEWPDNQEWPSYDRKLIETDGRTFKVSPLDFDEFMAVCKAIECVPTIVVCYDSMYKPTQANGVAPTRAQLLEHAREWVRYANITKKYNVKYWEIGNESWLPHYNGSATASNYAQDLIAFSTTMKAVDPTIRIGANGESDSWWKTVLSTASGAIDFLAIHNYPAMNWGSYGYYQNNTVNLVAPVAIAQNAINSYAPSADRNRLTVAVTEINTADWSGAWPHVNDLGHALALFDAFGMHLRNPKIEFTQLWNTRWSGNDTATTPVLWDAFDKNNDLQATGRVTAIWGQFLKEKLVASSSTSKVRTYSTYSPSTGRLTVFLINKDSQSRPVSLTVANAAQNFVFDTWVFTGNGPQDVYPTWTAHGQSGNAGTAFSLALAPVSVTVLDIAPNVVAHAVPGIIQAEDFRDDSYWDATAGNSGSVYRSTDVDIQATSDTGGGYNLGWISAAEWLDYTISVPTAGAYLLSARVASPHSGKALRFMLNGQALTGQLGVPNTGGWQKWQTITQTVNLPAGTHRLTVVAVTNGFNLNWMTLAPSTTTSVSTLIQAEDFLDEGFWDSTVGNTGGAYRFTDVDIQPTGDSGGGFNVGWVAAGEWLEYAITIPSAGTFDVAARIATINTGRSFRLLVNGVDVTGTVTVPTTGSYQKWQTVTRTNVSLPAGTHRLRFTTGTGGFNLNWLSLKTTP
jgi:alpha-N-arabinofuranosidase